MVKITNIPVPKSYTKAKHIFGYIVNDNGTYRVYGFKNDKNGPMRGQIEYTNIDPKMVIKSYGPNSGTTGPFSLNWWDCRINKNIDSVIA